MTVFMAVYAACVDFLLQAARLFGVTYRDANAFMFFVLWPVVTVLLMVVICWQRVLLWRRGRRGPARLTSSPAAEPTAKSRRR